MDISEEVISKQIIEARFKPDARFLDRRGAVADSPTLSNLLFEHWNIAANRIDFSSKENAHIRAFFSYKNLGLVSVYPNKIEFFKENAESFIRSAWSHLPNREFSRIGMRLMFLVETDSFDKALDGYRQHFLKLSDDEIGRFGGKLIDVGFPLDFVDNGNHRDETMTKDERTTTGVLAFLEGRTRGSGDDSVVNEVSSNTFTTDFRTTSPYEATSMPIMSGLVERDKKDQPSSTSSYMEGFSLTASLVYTLIEKMDEMLSRIGKVEQRITSLEEFYAMTDTEQLELGVAIQHEEGIQVSRKAAKEMILKLFKEKGELGYSEIVLQFDLDLKLVVEICAELEDEKKIEGIV